MSPKIMGILLMVVIAGIGAVGQIFFKKGSASFALNLSLLTNWSFIFACCLYGLALVLSMFAYKLADISILYPLMSLSYVFLIILAGIFLKEPITTLKMLGSLVIMIGVGLIAAA